jgi:hypothetical protein
MGDPRCNLLLDWLSKCPKSRLEPAQHANAVLIRQLLLIKQ